MFGSVPRTQSGQLGVPVRAVGPGCYAPGESGDRAPSASRPALSPNGFGSRWGVGASALPWSSRGAGSLEVYLGPLEADGVERTTT